MNIKEYYNLQSELQEVNRILIDTPANFIIERMSWENRKKGIEKKLASCPAPNREPARVQLTFNGKPVVGSQGIFADFGAQAVNAFTDTVSAIGASLNSTLGSRGIIPDKDKYRLLITGIAVGSFGFELEEPPIKDMLLYDEESIVESAIECTEKLIKATVDADDNDLTEAISDVDPRALDLLRKFFNTLISNDAVCSLSFKNRMFRFKNVNEVKSSHDRIKSENIHEEELDVIGEFKGYLPKRHTFEFLAKDSKDSILGKTNTEINTHLNKEVIAKMIRKKVGNGNPSYHLVSFELI